VVDQLRRFRCLDLAVAWGWALVPADPAAPVGDLTRIPSPRRGATRPAAAGVPDDSAPPRAARARCRPACVLGHARARRTVADSAAPAARVAGIARPAPHAVGAVGDEPERP